MEPETDSRTKGTSRDEKFERQKKMLQKLTLRILDQGCESGISPEETKLLKESLLVLGWLPAELASK